MSADVKDPAGAELIAAAHAVPESSPAWASVTYWGIRRQILTGDPDAARKWAEQALAAKPSVATANLLRAERLVRAGFNRGTPVLERDMVRDNWWSLLEERPDGDRDANHEALYDLYPEGEMGPEALHRVVEATHYGPADGKKSKEYSKQAFDILHRRYPNSEWTKKTKYWY